MKCNFISETLDELLKPSAYLHWLLNSIRFQLLVITLFVYFLSLLTLLPILISASKKDSWQPSAEEKSLLREEFLTTMQERFLSGQDLEFDYR